LQEHFASTPRSQLMQLLPRRGYQSMKNYVRDHHLGIRRQAKAEPGVPYLVSLEDWKIMEEYGISERELVSMRTAKLITWANLRNEIAYPFDPKPIIVYLQSLLHNRVINTSSQNNLDCSSVVPSSSLSQDKGGNVTNVLTR
jgi:hypothetical protein